MAMNNLLQILVGELIDQFLRNKFDTNRSNGAIANKLKYTVPFNLICVGDTFGRVLCQQVNKLVS